jgi:hypothetical protein
MWCPQVLIDCGVNPSKIIVVPEGMNTTYLDPSNFAPLELPQVRQKYVNALQEGDTRQDFL